MYLWLFNFQVKNSNEIVLLHEIKVDYETFSGMYVIQWWMRLFNYIIICNVMFVVDLEIMSNYFLFCTRLVLINT